MYIPYLRDEFVKQFSISYVNNSNLILFHRFDTDWNAYVELDDDSSLTDKDRLKVSISQEPSLITSLPLDRQCNTEEVDDTRSDGQLDEVCLLEPHNLTLLFVA